MITLIILGFCIIPIIFNLSFAYIMFKQEYKGKDATLEDLCNELNKGPWPLLL